MEKCQIGRGDQDSEAYRCGYCKHDGDWILLQRDVTKQHDEWF